MQSQNGNFFGRNLKIRLTIGKNEQLPNDSRSPSKIIFLNLTWQKKLLDLNFDASSISLNYYLCLYFKLRNIVGAPCMLVKDGKIFFKLIYWGPAASGKTTCLATLRKLTQQESREVKPIGDLTEISMASGATLYFDHGIFQSTQDPHLFYHVYTVAGQSRFGILRKKVLKGTDGLIVVFDSNSPRWDDCVNSLKELRNFIGQDLLGKIPLVVLLNKRDLPSVISVGQVKNLLRELELWSDSPKQANQNPKIYESIALYDKEINIYESFNECAHRSIEKMVEPKPTLERFSVKSSVARKPA